MLGFLFRGLTAEPAQGSAMFAAVTAEARQTHWYLDGEVPDSLDGRFAVLSTLLAIFLVRLERDGDAGNPASVALTERFIAVMEAEHRELGQGDPTLGKTVRKLVASLARRTDLWREAVSRGRSWSDAARDSLYREEPSMRAVGHSAGALERWRERLDRTDLARLEQGEIG